jgi:hypothetical protein
VNIRTEENLSDRLSADLIWRKREISVLRWLIAKATTDRRDPLLRAAVALLYAHWEGFIKEAGTAYLEFVHFRRLRHCELAPNFIALAARSILRRASTTNKLSAHLEVTQFFLSRLDEQSHLPYKESVRTRANLSSAVLREIVDTLGLGFSAYETKVHIIDERLLQARNNIAHGQYLLVDEKSVDELASEVLGMLETFRTQIENAAFRGDYRVSTSG